MYCFIGYKNITSQKGNQVYFLYLARMQVNGVYEAITVFCDKDNWEGIVAYAQKEKLTVGDDINVEWDWGNRPRKISKA